MEDALKLACTVPLDVMRAAAKALVLLEELVDKGSVLAVSDVGCGAACCKAAIQSAGLSVFINTKSMTDKAYAMEIEEEAEDIISKSGAKADEIYGRVMGKLR